MGCALFVGKYGSFEQSAEVFRFGVKSSSTLQKTKRERTPFWKEQHFCWFQLAGPFDVVVNCAGYGNKQLVGDRDLIPIKGHLIRVGHRVRQECFKAFGRANATEQAGAITRICLRTIAVRHERETDIDTHTY